MPIGSPDNVAGRPPVTIASFEFLGFAAVVALLYAAAPGLRWRQALLLVANLGFLATFAASPAMFLPLASFLAVSYGGLLLVMATRNARLHFAVIVIVIAMFFWLKRYSFLPTATFLPFAYTTIGLSYIFFRNLHLLIDAHELANEGAEQERIGLVSFLNYTLNFTSLVSGPIQLFQSYARDQLQPDVPPLDWIAVGNAIERIAVGFFKVIVLGAFLYAVYREALAALGTDSGPDTNIRNAMLVSVGYTLYPLLQFFRVYRYRDRCGTISIGCGCRKTSIIRFLPPVSSISGTAGI